jgi:hypothetical protein
LADSCNTLPVPSNNTLPTVPLVMAVEPTVKPVAIVNVLLADKSCVVPLIVIVRVSGTLELKVDQSAELKAPLFVAEAVGRLNVCVLVADEIPKSVPAVPCCEVLHLCR